MHVESTSLFLGAAMGAASALVGLIPFVVVTRRFARLQLALLRSIRGAPPSPSSANAPPPQELELDEGASPTSEKTVTLDYSRRLLLAQHWARGSLLSHAHETWRPICQAIAIAALACEDLDALGRLLSDAVGQAGADPQLANVWRQALLELHEGSRGEGSAIVDSANWPFPALRVRSRELLASAQLGAEQLVSATH
jgi:hypothetical protein